MKYSEQLWESLGFLTAATFLTFVFMSMFSSHKVNKYYLEINEGIPCIYLDVEWSIDGMMELDRDIAYEQAVELVNKLNK